MCEMKGKISVRKMSILEWNINTRSTGAPIPTFVSSEILNYDCDIIVLTEYKKDDDFTRTLSESNYNCIENYTSDRKIYGNGIMIGIKKEVCNSISVIEDKDVQNCYNFLHIRTTFDDDSSLDIIGVRMLSPNDNIAFSVQHLNNYVENLKKNNINFVCVGDFNIIKSKMPMWFKDVKLSSFVEPSDNNFLQEYSIVYSKERVITGVGAVDHMFTSDNITSKIFYDWNYLLNYSIVSNLVEIGSTWNVSPPNPDHAILLGEFDILIK